MLFSFLNVMLKLFTTTLPSRLVRFQGVQGYTVHNGITVKIMPDFRFTVKDQPGVTVFRKHSIKYRGKHPYTVHTGINVKKYSYTIGNPTYL